jgi:type IV pilus assembly protein PilV
MRSQNSGFTLLEVLVALVVFSLGMLGAAGTLSIVEKANASSYLHQHAIGLAYEMIDRMRANRGPALQGAYTGTYNDTLPTTTTAKTCPGTPPSASSALVDQLQWQCELLTSLLPSATGVIAPVLIANGDAVVAVTVSWDDRPAVTSFDSVIASGATTRSFTLVTVL